LCDDCKRAAVRIKNHRRNHRRKTNGPRDEIDPLVVFERDGWVCQLCFEPIDRDAPPRTSWSPTVDHIIPLVKGGTDTYDNVQAAHHWCNCAVKKADPARAGWLAA